MNDDEIDQRLMEWLTQASNLQLHKLHAVTWKLLSDPRRMLPIRRDLHLGQTVEFLDTERGAMTKGKVIALLDRQAEVRELASGRRWKLPYTLIRLTGPAAEVPKEPEPPQALQPPRPGRDDFRKGDRVAFEDRYLETVVGTVVRINQRTASIDPGDGMIWRVSFALLRPVVDV